MYIVYFYYKGVIDLELTITSIEAQKRLHRFNLYLNQKFAFGISEETLLNFQLHKGQVLNEETLAEIKNNEHINQAYQTGLNYLSYQMRSCAEVEARLKSKEYTEDVIAAAIEKLKQQKLLNDYQFALAYLRTMQKTSDKGPYEIKKKLQAKKIPPELIEKAFAEYDTISEQELLIKLVEKYFHHYHNSSFKERINKTKQRLLAKGFDHAAIETAITATVPTKDTEQEYQTLQKLLAKVWQKYHTLPLEIRKQKCKQFLFRKGFTFNDIDQALNELTDD